MRRAAASWPRWVRALMWAMSWYIGISCMMAVALGTWGASVLVLFATGMAILLIESNPTRHVP